MEEETEAPPLGLSKRALFAEGEAAAAAAWTGSVNCCADCELVDGLQSGSVTGRLRDGAGWRGSWRSGWSEMMTVVTALPDRSGTRRSRALELEFR